MVRDPLPNPHRQPNSLLLVIPVTTGDARWSTRRQREADRSGTHLAQETAGTPPVRPCDRRHIGTRVNRLGLLPVREVIPVTVAWDDIGGLVDAHERFMAGAHVDLPSGPPLGLGGMPFETAELQLAEGSQLVLYTDGLVEDRMRDIDTGLDQLRTVLARADRAPEETCEAVLDALLPARPSDDVALLVARTHALGPDQVAQWDLPSDPAVVSRSRAAVTEQLAAWGLDEPVFTTELLASELVTNAIRHATGPVQLRLLRDAR
ncbi:Stage II sporulation protein E (SpoIIE) [Streptomyces sp. Go-475]|nr:Stage II sporulation protein E (SpoIIE) [Streptomyces sp. Go-475]